MGKQTIEIDEIPRGPNGTDGLLRMNRHKRSKYNEDWWKLIRSQMEFHPAIPAEVRCFVRIHQVRRQRFDKDNLYASCKPILDALENLNLIYRDSEKWIDFQATQEVCRRRPVKTIITIEAENGPQRHTA